MKTIDSQIQWEILINIQLLKDGGKYSQLKVKDIENDLYNYHLQQLVKNGYVEKIGDLYRLTEPGKSLVTNIDEIDKKPPANYKVSVYMCVVVGGRILLSRRLKHPQYGYVGLPSGKIKYGEEVLSTASREFFEETNLRADFKIVGNLRQIRKNKQGDIIEDGVFYVCYSDDISGELTPSSIDCENFWIEVEEVAKIDKLFKPSVEIVVGEVLNRLRGQTDWNNKFIIELKPEPEDY